MKTMHEVYSLQASDQVALNFCDKPIKETSHKQY